MEIPQRIEPKTESEYLDVMSKSVFQSGLSWKVVESKWPGTREALHGFDLETLAELTDDDLDRLTEDSRIIRSRRKLAAVVHNARRMIELSEKHGGFQVLPALPRRLRGDPQGHQEAVQVHGRRWDFSLPVGRRGGRPRLRGMVPPASLA